jgi:hypothetical protein
VGVARRIIKDKFNGENIKAAVGLPIFLPFVTWSELRPYKVA